LRFSPRTSSQITQSASTPSTTPTTQKSRRGSAVGMVDDSVTVSLGTTVSITRHVVVPRTGRRNPESIENDGTSSALVVLRHHGSILRIARFGLFLRGFRDRRVRRRQRPADRWTRGPRPRQHVRRLAWLGR